MGALVVICVALCLIVVALTSALIAVLADIKNGHALRESVLDDYADRIEAQRAEQWSILNAVLPALLDRVADQARAGQHAAMGLLTDELAAAREERERFVRYLVTRNSNEAGNLAMAEARAEANVASALTADDPRRRVTSFDYERDLHVPAEARSVDADLRRTLQEMGYDPGKVPGPLVPEGI
jgi:hypothetical protein